MVLINSSQYYNVIVFIVVSRLYDVDYLPLKIEWLQENTQERQNISNYFYKYRNDTAVETPNIIYVTLIL